MVMDVKEGIDKKKTGEIKKYFRQQITLTKVT